MAQQSVLPWLPRIARRLPWRVQEVFLRRWPSAYQYLRFGVSNANTQAHWDKGWARHGVDGYRATFALPEIRQMIVEAMPRGVNVLDAGCGVGEIMTLLTEQCACHCAGMDIAPSAVAAVQKKGMPAKVGILPEVPFEDASFDVLLCTEVLEHVTDAGTAVKNFRRVLKQEGLLILTVPDGDVDVEEFHVHRFTEPSLRKLLSQHGFSVSRIVRVNTEVCPSFFVEARKS